MILFFYTLILLLVAVGSKVFQSGLDSYFSDYGAREAALVLVHYFGLLALWGRAKGKRILVPGFWKLYLVVLVFSILLVPVYDPTMQESARAYGWPPVLLGYGLSCLFWLPYLYGLYDYAWRNKTWRRR